MIAWIQGTVLEKSAGEAVLLTQGGVGYRLFCSMNTLASLPGVGKECALHAQLVVREDAMELYGFEKADERDMFLRLNSVSGIGPKTALFILGSMSLQDLRLAILTGDINALSRAPGVGKKTAQRIALELKDKVTEDALSSGLTLEGAAFMEGETPADALGEALQALKTLGYSPQEAANALKGVKGQGETADELIRLALRHMAQQG